MRRRVAVRAALLLVVAALCVTGVAAQTTASAPPALAGPALRDALQKGGFVLYFRHTSTDFGQNDEGMTSYEDCAKQRNLTDRGRAEARAIGAAIVRLRIPVGEVLASPYCRTVETGRLIFGRATVSNDVRGGPATADADRYAGLRKLMSTPPGAGTNRAIASHGNPFYAVAGPPYLAEGEAAIVEPRGADGFRIIGRITKDGWDALGGS